MYKLLSDRTDKTIKPSATSDANETAQNRAQAEQFSMDVNAPELIEITNQSHANPAARQYTVAIDDVTENLMAWTCLHHVHRNAVCKHMAAVESATNDGTLDAFPSEDEDDTEPDDCDCDGLNGFPCWPCVRTGRKELPNEPPLQLFLSMARQLTFSNLTDQRTLTESED